MQGELVGTPASDDTSDAVLLLRTREGDAEAYGGLYLRHVGAARVLGRQLARDPSEADELVSEGFARVLAVLQRGGGPEASLRPYLLSTMRRLHIDRRMAEQKQTPTEDLTPHDPGEPFVDLPAQELERTIVSTAYESLPERWRLVLWHTEVEGLTPAQVAPLLGISANATAALAVRARAGLRDAYLSAHVNTADDPECRVISQSLGGYVRGTLSRRERTTVEAHLEDCSRCSAAVLELGDTAATMRAVIGPLILGASVLAYRDGLIALGPHAIPSAALLGHGAAAGVAAGHAAGAAGAAAGAGASSGSGAAAASTPWPILAGAGVAGVVVLAAAAAAFGLGGHHGHRPSAAPPAQTSTSAPATAGAVPSSSPTAATSTSTAPPVATATTPGPAVVPVVGPVTPSPSTTPLGPAPAAGTGNVLAVGDLVPGRTGLLRLTATNPGSTSAVQTLQLTLPAGIGLTGGGSTKGVLERQAIPAPQRMFGAEAQAAAAASDPTPDVTPTAGPAGACTGTGSLVTCRIGTVQGGTRAVLNVPITVSATSTGGAWSAVVTATAHGRTTTSRLSGELATDSTGLNALFAGVGHFQVTAAGAALLSCQDAAHPSSACSSVEQTRSGGSLLDDDWTMYAVNDAGAPWTTSSSATLALPKGSAVKAAWLSWSASGVDAATADRTAELAGPGGKLRAHVTAGTTWADTSIGGRPAYVAVADVTAQVAADGAGTYTVGDIALPGPQMGTYGGWTLTVVTSTGAAPVRAVTILAGPEVLGDTAQTWTGSAIGLGDAAADLTFEAWEGDAGLTGDSLKVRGTALAPLDGVSGADDVAASYALGATRKLTFGVDVRQLHAKAGPGDQIQASSTGDKLILGLLAVSAGA